ncbi:hypothetical protein J8273_5003 [Carpediemonas membranifera]|uniref:Uncharacterized protein n=1 Tax=Carpediemonas membranifera TaxID=201153 RepID=A0A8J6E3R2_9EUKA|nr:hypothetical protein J8273_5003 [Carpediemonas membranifera]|eukprot:KAG9393517.1 hypothetical protein J8273_5003 [Carpediemonas membranifera]
MSSENQQWVAFRHLASLYTMIRRGNIENPSASISKLEASCVEAFVTFWLTTKGAETIYTERTKSLAENYGTGVVHCSVPAKMTRDLPSTTVDEASSIMSQHLTYLRWCKIALSCKARTREEFATENFDFDVCISDRWVLSVMVCYPCEFMVWYKALIEGGVNEEEFHYFILWRCNCNTKGDHSGRVPHF